MPAATILYPPLVDTYMPAFLEDSTARIYFSKTTFNNHDSISHVQLSLSYLSNNANALNDVTLNDASAYWPNQIKLCKIFEDTDSSLAPDYKYYIEINLNDLKNSVWETQQYYKAQLRFSSTVDTSASDYVVPGDVTGILRYKEPGADWFRNNLLNFSEWSTICLLKAIPEPVITMQGLQSFGQLMNTALYDRFLVYDVSALTTWLRDTSGYGITKWYDSSGISDISGLSAATFDTGAYSLSEHNEFSGNSGSMLFVGQYSDADNSEALSSYEAILYKATVPGGTSYEEVEGSNTGTLYPISTYQNGDVFLYDEGVISEYLPYAIFNGFNFRFEVLLEDSSDYKMDIQFITKNGYVFTKTYYFITAFSSFNLPYRKATIEADYGRIKLDVSGEVILDTTGQLLVIMRADDTTNFVALETLFEEQLGSETSIIKTYYDYTAESGRLYKYYLGIDVIPRDGIMYEDIYEYLLVQYEDVYLVGNQKQLTLKFNPKISNFKYNVIDSKTETLGGRYPFIRRNADIRYKEFTFGGLISFQMDDNDLFITDTSGIYQNYAPVYNIYNTANDYNNIILEKKFRDEVLDFLYDGQVKLFKSATEGNMLVRVMDISLTPIDSLGRMIYEFSATMTEVAEFTVDNCALYSLQVS